MVSKSYPDGGCHWEFGIRHRGDIGVRVEVFYEAWKAFTDIPDLFRELAGFDGQRVSLDDIRAVLDRLGFRDQTARTNLDRVDMPEIPANLEPAVQARIGDAVAAAAARWRRNG